LFKGGMWQLADKMAADLGPTVVLNAQVLSIHQDETGVTVATPKGEWRGRYAVVTAPPALASRIQYSPALPALRDGLTQRMPLGCVIKVHVAYARPFWRDQGLTGLVLSDRTAFGPWFDHSPANGSTGGLVGFFDGAPAQQWADRLAETRRAQVLKDIALYFGDASLVPVDYLEESGPLSVESRRLRFGSRSRSADSVRHRFVGARWPHPLGRHRNRGCLDWLHRRRNPFGRARRPRSLEPPGDALSCITIDEQDYDLQQSESEP
jgi:hypothetical protein